MSDGTKTKQNETEKKTNKKYIENQSANSKHGTRFIEVEVVEKEERF